MHLDTLQFSLVSKSSGFPRTKPSRANGRIVYHFSACLRKGENAKILALENWGIGDFSILRFFDFSIGFTIYDLRFTIGFTIYDLRFTIGFGGLADLGIGLAAGGSIGLGQLWIKAESEIECRQQGRRNSGGQGDLGVGRRHTRI